MSTSGTPDSTHRFEHNGRLVYSWHQDISEVEIGIPLPDGATKKDLAISISSEHLTVGLVGLPPYLNVRKCEDPALNTSGVGVLIDRLRLRAGRLSGESKGRRIVLDHR
jgi:CS domain